MPSTSGFELIDLVAVTLFLLAWAVHSLVVSRLPLRNRTLSHAMHAYRFRWMENTVRRGEDDRRADPEQPPAGRAVLLHRRHPRVLPCALRDGTTRQPVAVHRGDFVGLAGALPTRLRLALPEDPERPRRRWIR